MGVPSFYRWLSEKYPKVVSNVIEDVSQGADPSQPNPNQQEFDNLYLDMNGLIHPCCHPEDKPQPSSEDEMIAAVFDYIDRIFNMVRPRRLLYMAIDGVAPRAKMNQQRSRRFRAAQEMEERRTKEEEIREAWAKEGRPLPPRKPDRWDHNVITPGTPFMQALSKALVFYVNDRLTNNPGWANIQVIFSDATVPGEGEHKIMQFIRVQRAQPGYPPNLKHVIYGMDADLIMLSLATHEPHFTIVRETVLFGKDKGCHTCGQKGHFAADCTGKAKEPETEFDETEASKDTPFQFLSISILREYLAHELLVEDLPFAWDLERVIDDFVFLCFFVGNDFLPHLPSLEIREGALDELMKLYKQKLPSLGGYLTDSGVVDLSRADIILDHVGSQEAEILRRRHRKEQRDKERNDRQDREREAKQQRTNMKRTRSEPNLVDADTKERKSKSRRSDISSDIALGGLKPVVATKRVVDVIANQGSSLTDNLQAADALRAKLSASAGPPESIPDGAPNSASDASPKVALDVTADNTDIETDGLDEEDIESVPEEIADIITAETHDEYTNQLKKAIEDMNRAPDTEDTLRFYEDGYKDRYYKQKFNYSRQHNSNEIQEVARHYAQGLCWVLLYYYKGCQSWEWYYPYHYAPFASDLRNMDQFDLGLELGKPFSPFSQLMGVLPAASSHCLPEQYRKMMSYPTSPIIHFYPTDFKVDLNGKKWAWQAVVLLPFIDQDLLLSTLSELRENLTPDEKERDSVGVDYLFVNSTHDVGIAISAVYLKFGQGTDAELRSRLTNLDVSKSKGVVGKIAPYAAAALPAATVKLNLGAFSRCLKHNRAISAVFYHPSFTDHKSSLLEGTVLADPALSPGDFSTIVSFKRYGGRSLMFNADQGQGQGGNSTPRKQMLSKGAIRLTERSLPRDRRSSYPPANDQRYSYLRYEDEASYAYSARSSHGGDPRLQYQTDERRSHTYFQQPMAYDSHYRYPDDRAAADSYYSSGRYQPHPSSYAAPPPSSYDYRYSSGDGRESSYRGPVHDDYRYSYQGAPQGPPAAHQPYGNYDMRQQSRAPQYPPAQHDRYARDPRAPPSGRSSGNR